MDVARRYTRLRNAALAALGPASPARAVADRSTRPLIEWLGWAPAPSAALTSHGCWTVLVAPSTAPVALLTMPWSRDASGAARWAADRALGQGIHWVLISNGRVLRLLDARRPAPVNWLEFDLDLAGSGEAGDRLAALLAPMAFRESPDGLTPLDRALRAADEEGVRLRRSMRLGVREALGFIERALGRAGTPEGPSRTRDALTAVYRLLFLHFAEARGLVPSWHPAYRDGYTLGALVTRLLAGGATRGTWAALQAMARLAHAGCAAEGLLVPAFNGPLFSPARAPRLDRLHLDDTEVARALESLSCTPESRGGRRVIAYADLGVEELGSIYEHLLDDLADGHALRKSTGTFYTPQPLTDYLVRVTLAPLVEHRTSDGILALRILDPAMGSGAFLVSVCRYLAAALERALIAEGRCQEHDIDEAVRAGLRREVARRCLFGVDANPMAVELARLSLWLATLSAGRPLSFLDHHLRCGNSLVGASPSDVLARPPGRAQAGHRRAGPLEAYLDACGSLAPLIPLRLQLERTPDDSVAAVHGKERMLGAILENPALERWRDACSLWCALWFPAGAASRRLYSSLLDHVLGRRSALPAATARRHASAALEAARRLRCFHWPLEFPEAFLDAEGQPRPDGGFDAVVGNPPWEMIRRDAHGRPDAPGLVRFTRDSGLYAAQRSGHPNEYQLFLERALGLLRPAGRLGLLLPSGVLTDSGSAGLRRSLLRTHRLESVAVVSNRRGIFPIHRGLRFAAMTAERSAASAGIKCRFGLESFEEIDRLDPHARAGFPVVLSPRLLERLAGEDLAFPDLPSSDDVRLVERLASRHPALGAAEGWAVSFGRELNATDDRDCLRGQGGPGLLPVVEGKHLEPFRLRPCTRWADAAAVCRRMGARYPSIGRRRLAYREVASATNRLTLIAALVPAGAVCLHTAFCLHEPLDEGRQLALCALLNSYVANYLVRRWVTTHVTASIMARLPVPAPGTLGEHGDDLSAGAGRLTDGPRDASTAPRLQALAARTYGLTREEFAHVLGTLPLIDPAVRRAAFDAFTA